MERKLSESEVRHVAKLAYLRPSAEQVAKYQVELASVLEHIERLNELDVAGVEPLSHPQDLTNRLAQDSVDTGLDQEQVLKLAPKTLESYISVPSVFGEHGA